MKMILKDVTISGRKTNIIIDGSKEYYQGQRAGRAFELKVQKDKVQLLKRNLARLKDEIRNETARIKDIRSRQYRTYEEYVASLEKEYGAKAEPYEGDNVCAH